MIYAITFVIAALGIFELYIWRESKKALYLAWKREFERELGSSREKVDEIVIRELYDSTMTPKEAVEYYLETTELCAKTEKQLD